MRRGKRDANHASLAATFEKLGCTVVDTSSAGIPGFPDLVVGCIGINHLVELKNADTRYGRAGLSPNQSAFNRGWNGACMVAVATEDDVAALVGYWRQGVRRCSR